MSNETEESRNRLVIIPRPQISVDIGEFGDEVVITTASIDDNFRDVEHDAVRIPVGCLREVADALIAIANELKA